jgi:hypothetical protein
LVRRDNAATHFDVTVTQQNTRGARAVLSMNAVRGTITLSDHFAAWKNQGWSLGSLASAYINVETGSGVGNIQFPVANFTVSN